jgi:ketosteroid isomerase-like protein
MYGGDAVVTGYVSQRLRSKGRTFKIPFALRLTVSGGRISRYYIYEDSPTVSEAVAS